MNLLSDQQLLAEDEGKNPEDALDRVVDELYQGIKRHTEFVRRDHISRRNARNRADLNESGPALQRDLDSGRREGFIEQLRPHLLFLRALARRELRILELQGKLPRGEVTVDDVLNDVLILAWERSADRPKDLPLDLWLIRLLDQTLRGRARQEPRPPASLGTDAAKVSIQATPRSDEQESSSGLLGDEERLALEALLPGEKASGAWNQIEEEQQSDRLLSLLGELPPPRRQAFLLYTLEGYSITEIALLQDRPESEVKADIEAARHALLDRLKAGGHVQEVPGHLAATGTAGETPGE